MEEILAGGQRAVVEVGDGEGLGGEQAVLTLFGEPKRVADPRDDHFIGSRRGRPRRGAGRPGPPPVCEDVEAGGEVRGASHGATPLDGASRGRAATRSGQCGCGKGGPPSHLRVAAWSGWARPARMRSRVDWPA